MATGKVNVFRANPETNMCRAEFGEQFQPVYSLNVVKMLKSRCRLNYYINQIIRIVG